MNNCRVLVTGGAGFIGSNLIHHLLNTTDATVLNVDKLTYAGNLHSLAAIESDARYHFLQADICNMESIQQAFAKFQPSVVMHLAAESHVDRSIDGPSAFIETNIAGTYTMLQCALEHWRNLRAGDQGQFRFHHISTDEVFGSLGADGYFLETTPYDPRSPYSASKASSDHLVRSWFHTYGLPTLITNCSNNYGPFQFPEKLIPLVLLNAMARKPLPIYGKGDNIRDWLHVDDHVKALWTVIKGGVPGRTYNIGGNMERTNLQVVQTLCKILDDQRPHQDGSYADLIEFVADRPGHDKRYAIDASRIKDELGWEPAETFESGIEKTIHWYLRNEPWWRPIREGTYTGKRLGLSNSRSTS